MLADAATHDARVTLYLWDSQIQTDVNPTTEATWRNDGHDSPTAFP